MSVSRVLFRVVKEKKKNEEKRNTNTFDPSLRFCVSIKVHVEKGEVVVVSIDRFVKKRSNTWFRYKRAREKRRDDEREPVVFRLGISLGTHS